MISLFLGELYRLGVARRLWLVLGGFIMAFGFNVLRTFVLAYIAASKGVSAIPEAKIRWVHNRGVLRVVVDHGGVAGR